MILKNQQIYKYANDLMEFFNDNNQKLPIKINFYLQKNKRILLDLARDIEEARMTIAKEYGILDEEANKYTIKPENIPEAQKELDELFSLEQEVDLCVIDIDSLNSETLLTTGQMEALLFMIE